MPSLVLRLIAFAAALAALFVAPSVASATDCGIPGSADPTMTNVALDTQGDIPADRQRGFVQIPFTVPNGTTAIRVRYSYDQPGGGCSGSPNTLDMGVYGPKPASADFWPIESRRGWSGSAVKDLAIAENGWSPEADYENARKAYVSGYTTRAYRPGPMPPGQWAVELGVAFVDPADADGIHYHVKVETSTDPSWADDPFEPSGYSAAVVRPERRWYAGDLHVHGEMEPGNAPISKTLDRAFDPISSGGSGLDFISLVDHNNNSVHDDLARFQSLHPSNLVIPGVEMTTYRGHYNNQGKAPLVDFRNGPIYDESLQQVRGAVPPAETFAQIQAAGNWTQVNHPTIFRTAPSFCRGCAWSYDDAETDYSKVDAIEIQTGPAGVPAPDPTGMNPFTPEAIALYEGLLDAGERIAAVGSSDDHQGGGATGPFDSPVGSATTKVLAANLSEQAITDGIKEGRTYVKLFGNDGPDIDVEASTSRGAGQGTIGDTLSGCGLKLDVTVDGASASGRPGQWRIELLRDGDPMETVAFGGDGASYEFKGSGTARYAFQVIRKAGPVDFPEVYTSPLWFVKNCFKVSKAKRNKRKGTATLTVKAPGPGTVRLRGRNVGKAKAKLEGAGEAKLKVKPRGKLKRRLAKRGRVPAPVEVVFAPEGGDPASKSRVVRLVRR